MKKYRIKYIASTKAHWVMDYSNENRPIFVNKHPSSASAEQHIKKLNQEQRELTR